MRVVVDLTRCQGYAQCAFLAPEAFRMVGDEALMFDPAPDDSLRERVLRAAAACPVQALQVDMTVAPRREIAATAKHGKMDVFKREGRIVIVGASLAGLRAAEMLRSEGFTGTLTVIGDEPHEPYDRPPLSKQVQTGWITSADTTLPRRCDIDADWRLGVAATGLDLDRKVVKLADGAEVEFDRVLISTGVRARPWPVAREAALDGVFTLRTREDAAGLRERLLAKPRRVLVIGAGFTGSEMASVCVELGIPVTVAEAGPVPLYGALGGVIGRISAEIMRERGVDLRTKTMVTSLEGDDGGRLRRAHLSDGTTVDVDVAVVALGGIRNVEWLEETNLATGIWGLACDAGCRAFDANGLVTDDVFVAGDVARQPQPMFGYQFVTLEHWSNSVTQAEVAAHNMVSEESDRWPHLAVPAFWSLQFGNNIKSVGVPPIADEIAVVQGSVADRRFIAAYGYKGRVVGAVSFNEGRWLDYYEDLIEQAAPFPPGPGLTNPSADPGPVPAGFPERTFPAHDATVVVTGHDPSERRATLVRSARARRTR
ncbi:FAD-dependent oxidoreductase [Catellatospora tritici]|uniref:FAD-dependent oxidoreductase n=1 Tax=Catellatospora tritici TaxID=2851566 RepID=UPI001C2D2B90|nr:FAD-dependent oxidoreductase [Catellatospora tritici]MBV1852951.1 FAD-dependent oxidoreductase [Catellatospora tritici]